jgi:superfamily II DNA/RNA helicase
VPKDFQLLFFSATGERAREASERIAGVDLFMLDVTKEDTSKGEIKHYTLFVNPRKRVDTLRKLANVENFRALVFFNSLSDLGASDEKLSYMGLPVASLASDQDKLVRKAVLENFRNGKLKLLLTTNVLARGLDIEELDYVVNFDVPQTATDYTHRSGRVGRMGRSGAVVTFVDASTKKDFQKILKEANLESEEIYLYGGNLTTEAKTVSEKFPKVAEQPAKNSGANHKTTPEDERIIKVKKKKNKTKNRKNKGAPKNKKR